MTRYEHCPKCAHTPLPAEQSLPAACPACGIVFAKYAAASAVAGEGAAAVALANESGPARFERARELLFHVPDRVDPTAFWGRAALLAAFALWGVKLIACDYRNGELGASFIHGPLLVFHEAGHVIFSPFGEFLTVLGGTLTQLLLPTIFIIAFLWRNRDPFGAALGGWLLGISLLDVAPYIYDALNPQLILLGGHTGEEGGHDWIYLLGELGLRNSAHGLGWFAHKLGALTVLLSIAWASWILKKQHSRLSQPIA